MLRSLFGKTLWEQRRALLGWAIGITAVGVMYAAFYPTIKSPEIAGIWSNFAPELLQAFGFADIVTPAGYIGSTTFGILGPVLMILFGTWLGIKAVVGDEDAGRLDLLLAHPITRQRLVAERFAALVVAAVTVSLALWLALSAISGVAEFTEIGLVNLLAGSIHLAVLGIFFGGLALAVGAMTGNRAVVIVVVAIVGVVGYFGNTMAGQVDALAFVRDLSPFHFYSGGRPLVNGFQVVDLAVLGGAAVALVAVGAAVFTRRDVSV
jgi:ABC-2 type transport system permease protein